MKPFKKCYPLFFKASMVASGLGALVSLRLIGLIGGLVIFLVSIALFFLAAGIYSVVLKNDQKEKETEEG